MADNKPAENSLGMWTAFATTVFGIATGLGFTGDLADYIGANLGAIVGFVVTGVGLVFGYSRARAQGPATLLGKRVK